jgi:biotin transporter BioY
VLRAGLRAGLHAGRHGGRSHLFSHVFGYVAVWCEMFALTGWFLKGKCRGAWVKCLLER